MHDASQTAVRIAMTMSVVERATNGRNHVGRQVDGKRSPALSKGIEHLLRIVTFDVLHHEVIHPLGTAEVEHTNDVGMGQSNQ